MKLPRLRSLILATLALAPAPASAEPFGPAPGTMRVKQVQAIDSSGFEKPLPAFSLLVPAEWGTEGGVVWTPNNPCNGTGYNFAFEAASPDGAYGVSILPTTSWTAAFGFELPQSGCSVADLRSARAFLEAYAATLVDGVEVQDYRPRPDLLQEAGAEAFNKTHQIGGGAFFQTAADAGEVLVKYRDEQGRTIQGALAAVTIHWHSHFPGIPSPGMGLPGMPDMDVIGGNNLPVFAAFAPIGQLDLSASEAIRKSITPQPEWSRRIAEHMRKIAEINRRGAAERANITARTNAEISDIIHNGYLERSAIRDRGHRETTEMIRGVETYNDPINGGTVQLDSTYSHAYAMNDGTYVLTNDAFFEPFREFGLDGQRLQVTP